MRALRRTSFAITLVAGTLLVAFVGVRYAFIAEEAAEARLQRELDYDLRRSLEEGARRLVETVQLSRASGAGALGFPVSEQRIEQSRPSAEFVSLARLEAVDEQAALDRYLALILETQDPDEQVAAMRGAARIQARRGAREPAIVLMAEALLVEGASEPERELAAEALAFYRGTAPAAQSLRRASARVLAAPHPEQVVVIDGERCAWRLGAGLAVARTDDVLRAVVPDFARWEIGDGPAAPSPLPRLSFAPTASERRAVLAAAAAEKRNVLLLSGAAALALLGGAAVTWLALRRERLTEARKQAFTCAVTHELKTPIANIALYAETLREHGLSDPDNVPRFADVILAETERLRLRVQEVLDVAVGRAGFAGEAERFTPAAIVDETCAAFRSRGARIDVRAEQAEAHGRPALFRRALEGVLDNAVKFAPGKTITVDLEASNGRVELRVEDGGPGIPAAERERVFEPYVRLVDEMTREVSGTGLGLTLVRRCVEDCGGQVAIDTGARGGCRVTIGLEGAR